MRSNNIVPILSCSESYIQGSPLPLRAGSENQDPGYEVGLSERNTKNSLDSAVKIPLRKFPYKSEP